MARVTAVRAAMVRVAMLRVATELGPRGPPSARVSNPREELKAEELPPPESPPLPEFPQRLDSA